MFATIKAWLWVLPYAAIALCVAAIFYYRYEMSEAKATAALTQVKLDGVIATNEQQQKTIVAMAEIAKAKDEIVSKLSDDVAAINQSVVDNNKAFSDVYGSDPDAKAFSQRPIPDSIKRLHNHN